VQTVGFESAAGVGGYGQGYGGSLVAALGACRYGAVLYAIGYGYRINGYCFKFPADYDICAGQDEGEGITCSAYGDNGRYVQTAGFEPIAGVWGYGQGYGGSLIVALGTCRYGTVLYIVGYGTA